MMAVEAMPTPAAVKPLAKRTSDPPELADHLLVSKSPVDGSPVRGMRARVILPGFIDFNNVLTNLPSPVVA